MSSSSVSSSVEAERSSKNPTYIRRPHCLSRQPRMYKRSRSLISVPEHGHVGTPLGMSPISVPVIPSSAGMRPPTGMYANRNSNGIHRHE